MGEDLEDLLNGLCFEDRHAYVGNGDQALVDELLVKDRMFATILWKLPKRTQLEDLDELDPRESLLGDEVDEMDE